MDADSWDYMIEHSVFISNVNNSHCTSVMHKNQSKMLVLYSFKNQYRDCGNLQNSNLN